MKDMAVYFRGAQVFSVGYWRTQCRECQDRQIPLLTWRRTQAWGRPSLILTLSYRSTIQIVLSSCITVKLRVWTAEKIIVDSSTPWAFTPHTASEEQRATWVTTCNSHTHSSPSCYLRKGNGAFGPFHPDHGTSSKEPSDSINPQGLIWPLSTNKHLISKTNIIQFYWLLLMKHCHLSKFQKPFWQVLSVKLWKVLYFGRNYKQWWHWMVAVWHRK